MYTLSLRKCKPVQLRATRLCTPNPTAAEQLPRQLPWRRRAIPWRFSGKARKQRSSARAATLRGTNAAPFWRQSMSDFIISEFLAEKRDGQAHSQAAVTKFVRGCVDGSVTDYQAAAWL